MSARCSSSMPVVTNRSSAVPDSSITPSAAYRAPVSSAAVVDEPVQQCVERELRVESKPGLEELPQAALAVPNGHTLSLPAGPERASIA